MALRRDAVTEKLYKDLNDLYKQPDTTHDDLSRTFFNDAADMLVLLNAGLDEHDHDAVVRGYKELKYIGRAISELKTRER